MINHYTGTCAAVTNNDFSELFDTFGYISSVRLLINISKCFNEDCYPNDVSFRIIRLRNDNETIYRNDARRVLTYHRDTDSFDYASKGKSLVDDMMVEAINSYNSNRYN